MSNQYDHLFVKSMPVWPGGVGHRPLGFNRANRRGLSVAPNCASGRAERTVQRAFSGK